MEENELLISCNNVIMNGESAATCVEVLRRELYVPIARTTLTQGKLKTAAQEARLFVSVWIDRSFQLLFPKQHSRTSSLAERMIKLFLFTQ